jgi:urea transporter
MAFGLMAVLVASVTARLWNLDRDAIARGFYGYNALLVGLGVGQSVTGNGMALFLALAGATATVVVGAGLKAWLGRVMQLPILSLPFLIVFFLIAAALLPLGFEPRAPMADASLLASHLPNGVAALLRSLGAIFFLPRADCGALVLVALLMHSRIATVLAVGTAAVVLMGAGTWLSSAGPSTVQILACNAMLVVVAIGGVWFVPSLAAVAWALVGVLLCTLITVGCMGPLASVGLAPMFLPFNATLLCVLLAARERLRDQRPKSVDFIPGTPEENLNYFRTRLARFQSLYATRFHYPYRGRWICTQAIDGAHTHRGRWRHAFDFEVAGVDGKAWQGDGSSVEHYHCFRLPVLAAAAGTVVKVVSTIADNKIGEMNLKQNWGNLVMLQHGPCLFSLVAHLAQDSCKVREGQHVLRGEVLGLCGNSGRSPTPHLHFQLQATHVLGADTLPVAFNDVVAVTDIGERLDLSHVPRAGSVGRNLDAGQSLTALFNFHYGDVWVHRIGNAIETVVCEVDLLGQTQLRSQQKATCLVFARSEDYFVAYDVMGDGGSVLHLLRAAMPRVPLEDNPRMTWRDFVPLRGLVGRLSPVQVLTPFLKTGGLETQYQLYRDGARWVVEGRSLQDDKAAVPMLRTRVELEEGLGPVSVEVVWRGHRKWAVRLADGENIDIQVTRRGDDEDFGGKGDGPLVGRDYVPRRKPDSDRTDRRSRPVSTVL